MVEITDLELDQNVINCSLAGGHLAQLIPCKSTHTL